MDNNKELQANIRNIDFSKLQRYSIGVVVKDIEEGSNVIEVYPIEKIPDVKPNLQEKEKIKGQIDTGCDKITIEITKEKVIYAISDKPYIDPHENIENMYYLRINTFKKYVKIHFTNKYGEYTSYDLKFDNKAGVITFTDGKDNNIKWDSTKDQYTMSMNNDYTLNTGKTIHTNTVNETKNVKENLIIDLNHIAIKNSTTELISLLMEYIQTHIEEQHVGNLGIPTRLTSSYQSKYQDILNRLSTLKV